jgi:F420-dependent oxidoreductase-like protein
VKVGLTLPQGCDREFLGLDPEAAWRSTVEIAQYAEESGFESLWLYDHFQVDPPPEPATVFEPVVELASLAMVTDRARLGHLVLAAAYRNPALTAKMISTIDVISGGRAVLGIGAGWKEDEWLAYGYGFPDASTRLGILEDHLEIITRMFQPGSAIYQGRHAHVIDAIHEPKGIQVPRIPILIGGNGPKVTWRLAARFGDELNLDALMPAEVADAMQVIASRCEEIGRDPSTLPVSVHIWGEAGDVAPGSERQERFLEYGEVGVARIIVQGFVGVSDRPALESLVADCAAAGLLN